MLLSDGWKLRDFGPGHGLSELGSTDEQWLPIPVPGDVHRTLTAAGRIADPFYADNEKACAWMEQREWWYRLQLDAPAGRYRLIFHGLDTFATVYLDGVELGEHHNMFRPATFEIALTDQTHTLAVRFDPPLDRIKGKTLSAWGRNPERTAMR